MSDIPVGEISRVGVVGCGQMGAGIAEVCARSGLDVKVAETTGEALEFGRTRLFNSLSKAAERGKITEEERDETLARLSFTTDLGEFADRDLVIEAVVENEQVKTEIFQVLDQVVTRPDAILASNTSSIPLVKLAVATSRPDQVVGIHFFNPAPVQQLVELIPALTTSEGTLARAQLFAEKALGKHAIRAQDRSGFVVNALLIPYLLSAIRMFESGMASREDIDNGMELGCAHPMGPLKLSDLIGLDTVASVAFSMYEEYKEPLYAAPRCSSAWSTRAGWAGSRARASTRTHRYHPASRWGSLQARHSSECRARGIHTPCAHRTRICLSHTLPGRPPGELTLDAHTRDVTTTERSGQVTADPEHPVPHGELAELRRRLDVAYARVEEGWPCSAIARRRRTRKSTT